MPKPAPEGASGRRVRPTGRTLIERRKGLLSRTKRLGWLDAPATRTGFGDGRDRGRDTKQALPGPSPRPARAREVDAGRGPDQSEEAGEVVEGAVADEELSELEVADDEASELEDPDDFFW